MTSSTKNDMAGLAFDSATGVATITLKMSGRANKINDAFGATLTEALEWARGHADLRGMILASGHRDFCVGGDLDGLFRERDAEALMHRLRRLHTVFRAIEQSGVPVVAALTGSALGGGFELALACHHRIAIDDPALSFGLPEVNLGVLPGAGGTQRLPRLIGIQAGLELIAQGKLVRAPKAKEIGLVDALARDREALLDQAGRFIAENPGVKQPWDSGKRIRGVQPNTPDARNLFMAACGMLRKKTAGCYPAPELAISAIQEGLGLQFDRALEVEARYFTRLAISDQTKDMIRTNWYHRTAAQTHEGLPRTEAMNITKVGILGAGMMGAGLAFITAKAGLEVVLRDVGQDVLERAMAHAKAEAAKLKRIDAATREAILARIQPTLELDALAGCDLIIEAVFEDIALKHTVTREAEPKLAPTGIWASNTSALPISDLAEVSGHRDRFIGVHFFSPVEKMELLEIITTAQTSDATLARCLAYAAAIKKLPIVVGDGYGFYTTRVFSAYILEGAQLVAEGHDPVLIEWAARRAGMVVPPLQVFDEVTLSLGVKAFAMGRKYGKNLDIPGVHLVETLLEAHDRPGRAGGAGFYDYGNGRRLGLWAGLSNLVNLTPECTGVELLGQRLLALQAVEAARCVGEGVVKQARDAEVGAVFGVGFAPNTGGPLAYMDRVGIAAFVERTDGFADAYGERYRAPDHLREMARTRQRFFETV